MATAGDWRGQATVHGEDFAITYHPAPAPSDITGRKAQRWARSLHPGACIHLAPPGAAPVAQATYQPNRRWAVQGSDGRAWEIKEPGLHRYLEVLDGDEIVGRLSSRGSTGVRVEVPPHVDRHAQLLLLFVARCIFKRRNEAAADNLSAIG